MSLELTVYTRMADICTVERLLARLHEAGWEARVLNEYSRLAMLLPAGALPVEGVVYAWTPEDAKAERLARFFTPGRPLDAWALPEDLAACNISASQLETPDDQFELDQWVGDRKLPPEKLAVLQNAECRYQLSAWIAEGPHSDRLLRDTAWALAKETGGIIFNPQKLAAAWAEEMDRTPGKAVRRTRRRSEP